MDTTKARFAAKVFYTLTVRNNARLDKGAHLRRQMQGQLARGEEPTGYRADWLRESALRLLKELESCAVEFNGTYADDRCSAQDLIDIVATLHGWLTKSSE